MNLSTVPLETGKIMKESGSREMSIEFYARFRSWPLLQRRGGLKNVHGVGDMASLGGGVNTLKKSNRCR